MRFGILFGAAALALVSACATTPPPTGTVQSRIEADVAWLADDAREGREAGTAGYDAAAAYVADRMKAAGLRPVGRRNWLQEVPLRAAVRDLEATQLTLNSAAGVTTLVHLEDYIMSHSFDEATFAVSAPLVYAGYGVSAPEEGVDDYEGLDVAGKIVVLFSGAPPDMNSEKRAYYSSGGAKAKAAAARGAVGMLTIPSQAASERAPPWSRLVAGAANPGIAAIGPDGRALTAAPGLQASAFLNAAGAEKLFAGEAVDFKGLQAFEAQGKGAPNGFQLSKSATLAGASTHSNLRSANVIGLIEGSDPRLKREIILLTAHLDHIGVSRTAKPGEDAINNGALDNAGGVAVMLEAAAAFAASGKRPKRTIAFAAVTAEEKGLIGSDYLARNPAFGRGRIVANVNLDMPIALYAFTDVIAFGAERSTIGEAVGDAAQSMGIALSPDPIPQQNLFVRSDHFSFVKQGVPAVFLVTGFANGGQEAFESFLKDHYHKPSDDLSRPIDYEALARFTELNYRIARTLADAPEAPRWKDGDFFGSMFGK